MFIEMFGFDEDLNHVLAMFIEMLVWIWERLESHHSYVHRDVCLVLGKT